MAKMTAAHAIALPREKNRMSITRRKPRKNTSSQMPRVSPFTQRSGGTVPSQSNTKCPVTSDARRMPPSVNAASMSPMRTLRPTGAAGSSRMSRANSPYGFLPFGRPSARGQTTSPQTPAAAK